MLRQLSVFAVNGHEEARFHERQHQLELFLAAVAGDVDVFDPFVNYVGAASRQVIDDAADRLLVAGNRSRGEHHGVVRPHLHMAVIVNRNARQRRHRLALRAGRQAQHIL